MSGLRPRAALQQSFPDNTTFVDTVRRAQGVSAFSVEPGEDLRLFAGIFHPRTDEFPWSKDQLGPGERTPLRDISEVLREDEDRGQGVEVGFDNPHIVPDGFNFEIVQFWVNFEGTVEVMVWGVKPSVLMAGDDPTTIDDYEPIGPLFANGGSVQNHERVAEPTERALFDPEFVGEQPVAFTVENRSEINQPLRGKVFIAAVQRDPEVGD